MKTMSSESFFYAIDSKQMLYLEYKNNAIKIKFTTAKAINK